MLGILPVCYSRLTVVLYLDLSPIMSTLSGVTKCTFYGPKFIILQLLGLRERERERERERDGAKNGERKDERERRKNGERKER